MKETKLSKEMLDLISNNNGLSRYLSGLLIGREATPRSGLYDLEGKVEMLSADDVLAKWVSKLKTLASGSSFEKNVYQFDLSQLEKWGPQGEIKPIKELLKDIVFPSFSSGIKTTAFNTTTWLEAKRIVVRHLHSAGCKGLAPVPYKRVVDDMRARDTLISNSGWPLFTRRKKPEVVEQSISDAQNGQWKTYPAIALFRNYNQKTRLVWMFPMSANLVEGSFFQPLQQRLMQCKHGRIREFLSPWIGFEEVRKVVSFAYYGRGLQLAASDFSSTDVHFKLNTSLEVFDVLKECFQPRYRAQLEESIRFMHTIPLVIGPDTMLVGEHGVSSGSNWTNFVETIFDWILSSYVYLLTRVPGKMSGHSGLYAIGDDMTWYTHTYSEDFQEILAEIGLTVGQEIKAEKTTNDFGKVKSLQRLFQAGYNRPNGEIRAVYSTIRALKSLVYPEKFHSPKLWNKDMEAIRAFMILENCIDHPLFTEFCRFVSDGDPNLKLLAKKIVARRNLVRELIHKAKLIVGLNPTYNQEKRDQDLSSFESVKLISELD